jgi:hypothetical protein
MLTGSVWRDWNSRCLNDEQWQELWDISSGDWMLVTTRIVGIHMLDFPCTGTTKIVKIAMMNLR